MTIEQYSGCGRLVAHSDGYWHFLNRDAGLVAIPDAEVESRRLVARAG